MDLLDLMLLIVIVSPLPHLLLLYYLAMVRTKNTKRKYFQGLPRARFPRVATGAEERDQFYHLTLQLPPTAETGWTSLTPLNVTSPELERTVECLNAEHQRARGEDLTEVVELVEDLHDNPPHLLN